MGILFNTNWLVNILGLWKYNPFYMSSLYEHLVALNEQM